MRTDASPSQPPPLTRRQAEILHYIAAHIAFLGHAPTLDELRAWFTVGRSGMWEHVQALVRKGYLQHHTDRSRGLGLTAQGARWHQNRPFNPNLHRHMGDLTPGGHGKRREC